MEDNSLGIEQNRNAKIKRKNKLDYLKHAMNILADRKNNFNAKEVAKSLGLKSTITGINKEGLIEQIFLNFEEAFFGHLKNISQQNSIDYLNSLCVFYSNFIETNPAIARILIGEMGGDLVNMQKKVHAFHSRFELELKNIFKKIELEDQLKVNSNIAVRIICNYLMGQIVYYCQENFKVSISVIFDNYWKIIKEQFIKDK